MHAHLRTRQNRQLSVAAVARRTEISRAPVHRMKRKQRGVNRRSKRLVCSRSDLVSIRSLFHRSSVAMAVAMRHNGLMVDVVPLRGLRAMGSVPFGPL